MCPYPFIAFSKLRLGERLFTSVRDALEKEKQGPFGARFSYGPPVVHMYKIDTGFLILQGILIGTVFFSSTFYGFHAWGLYKFDGRMKGPKVSQEIAGWCMHSFMLLWGAHCG